MISKRPGINKISKNIRIVEIAPIEIMGKRWLCVGFEEEEISRGDNLHLALILNPLAESLNEDLVACLENGFIGKKNIIARIHSECILGDVMHSSLCDCGKQLSSAFKLINKEGLGIIVYLRQEGRGIGLRNKLSCLALQEGYVNGKKITRKYSPDEANSEMGHPVDKRSYDIAVEFLKYVKIDSVHFVSGNPEKIAALKKGKMKISRLIDIPRVQLTGRELVEIKEKISRNYCYPNFKAHANRKAKDV